MDPLAHKSMGIAVGKVLSPGLTDQPGEGGMAMHRGGVCKVGRL